MQDEQISIYELAVLCGKYYTLITELPQELRVKKNFPEFTRFISPANYSLLPDTSSFNCLEDAANDNYYTLSITGRQRVRLLRSPHANVLFRAYIAKHLM